MQLRLALALALICGGAAFHCAPAAPRRTPVRSAAEETDKATVEDAADDGAPGGAEEAANNAPDPNADLKKKVAKMEATLKEQRLALFRAKDDTSNAGEAGMYRLAAQIKTYKANVDTSNDATNELAKRDVMRAFEPMLAHFEELGAAYGSSAEESEGKMVTNFDESYKDLMSKFTKMGLVAFDVQPGTKYDAMKHDALEFTQGDADVDVVVSQYAPGYRLDSTGDSIRKAKVLVAKGHNVVVEEAAADEKYAADQATDAQAAENPNDGQVE